MCATRKTSSSKPLAPLGELRHSRPRPTYAPTLKERWLTREAYPVSNSRMIGGGHTLWWKVRAWRAVGDPLEGIQHRVVIAATFDEVGVSSAFLIEQTRNNSGADIDLLSYCMTCDDESQALYEHAEAASAVAATMQLRDWLEAGEIVHELDSLYVPQRCLGSCHWARAMTVLLHYFVAKSQLAEAVVILQAEPLELAWRYNGPWDPFSLRRFLPREPLLAERRRAALQRLYERELGVAPLFERWMGGALVVADDR